MGQSAGRRAGTEEGGLVCLFGKREPDETVARFSLDRVGAMGVSDRKAALN